MRSLYVTPQLSWPLQNGFELRRWNLLQGLLRAGPVDVLVLCKPGGLDPRPFAGCEAHHEIAGTFLNWSEPDKQRYTSTLGRGSLVLGRVMPFEYFGQDWKLLRSRVGAILHDKRYDVLFQASAHLAAACGRSTIPLQILDGDDYAYMRQWLELQGSGWYGAKIWNYLDTAKLFLREVKYPKQYSAVLRCSPEDVQRHPAANVFCIPNGTYIPASVRRNPGMDLLFVGDMGYSPNAQGLQWFASYVWPIVRSHCPEAKLKVAGRNPSADILALDGKDGIQILGFVADLEAIYAHAAAALAPLLAGGGTRLKVLESLSYGVPMVATSTGAFGISLGIESGLIRADDVESFAAACSRLIGGDSAAQLAALVGRKKVGEKYSWDFVQKALTNLVTELGSRRRQTWSRASAS